MSWKKSVSLKPDEVEALVKGRTLLLRPSLQSVTAETAKKIFGERFVTIEEIAKMLKLNISPAILERYNSIPYTKLELERANESGVHLVALPQISLGEIARVKTLLLHEPVESVSREGYALFGELGDGTHLSWSIQGWMIEMMGCQSPKLAEAAIWLLATQHKTNRLRCAEANEDDDQYDLGWQAGMVKLGESWNSHGYAHISAAVAAYRPLVHVYSTLL